MLRVHVLSPGFQGWFEVLVAVQSRAGSGCGSGLIRNRSSHVPVLVLRFWAGSRRFGSSSALVADARLRDMGCVSGEGGPQVAV